MNSRQLKRRGFTLIEVTLAIVIGIIMIAGATLIYNQAKTSAGNSRAQAKVASLQGVIEQYMARADGVAPELAALRAMWERARPDDWNKSPWGGILVPAQYPAGTDTKGVIDGNTLDAADLAPDKIAGNANCPAGGPGACIQAPPDPAWTGTLIYYKWPDAATYWVWDENRRQPQGGKSYTVATTNQRGERWFFVRGNTAGLGDESNPFGVRGQIQN